jgi:hypothetical protein
MASPIKKTDLHKFAPASELGPAEDYPAGSIEWAERISKRLQIGAKSITQHTVHHLWDTIKAIWAVQPRPWEIWPKESPFGTPDDYCLAVTGHSWEFLVGIVAEFASGDDGINIEAMRADLAKAQVEHRKQGAHVAIGNKRLTKGSNQREYLLRRLARDHSDILAAYERGEFKSVRAAAIEAGIIKRSSLFNQFRKLVAKMSLADCRKGLPLLEQRIEDEERTAISKNQLAMFQ